MPGPHLDRRHLVGGLAGASLLALGRPAGAQSATSAIDRPGPILIRGAIILTMDPALGTLPQGDILVRDGAIAAIERRIEAADARVVDATGCIALPGFVNAHIHLAQAILRGMSGDHTLAEYFRVVVARYSPRLTPEDVSVSDYAGALEQLDAGTTTIFDWSREALTPSHADAALDAMQRSGIRAVFGYGLTGPGQGGDAKRADILRLRGRFPSDDSRVRLGIALRGPDTSPMTEAEDDLRFARELGLPHAFHVGVQLYSQRTPRGVARLVEQGLIGPLANLVHANDLDADEYRMVGGVGGQLCVTPEVEMMMGHGQPATGRALGAGIRPALGTDIATGVSGDMFTQIRSALSAQRLSDNLAAAAAGKPLERVSLTTRQVLEAATIDGARALGLEARIGSLAPGKRADLILVRADGLATAPAHDPVSTIVLQASTASVDTVVVDGEVVKSGGRLVGRDAGSAVAELSERARGLMARAGAASGAAR